MVKKRNSDGPDEIPDGFDEDNAGERVEDEPEQATANKRNPLERLFLLFHLLSISELTREDIFEHLRDTIRSLLTTIRLVSRRSERARCCCGIYSSWTSGIPG